MELQQIDRNKGGKSVEEWQERSLPLMTWMIIGLTTFFFITGLLQLGYLQWIISQSPRLELSKAFEGLTNPPLEDVNHSTATLFQAEELKVLATLEGYILERRYHHANAALISRAWMEYLGFATGMILAVVGAIFILGKLREDTTNLTAQSAGLNFSLVSTSPGLILAVLGATLMITAIVTHKPLTVTDSPTYLSNLTSSIPLNQNFVNQSDQELNQSTQPVVINQQAGTSYGPGNISPTSEPQVKLLVCRGNDNANIEYGKHFVVLSAVTIKFEKGSDGVGLAKEDLHKLLPGQCSWLDRGMYRDEPKEIVFLENLFPSDQFSNESTNGDAKFSPGYINDMRDSNKFHSFYVYNDNNLSWIATKVGTVIHNLEIDNDSHMLYKISDDGVAKGKQVYMDRPNVSFASFPSYLTGLTYIQTAVADQVQPHVDDNPRFLSFYITSKTTIYVAFSDVVGIPDWLNGYEKTNDHLELTTINGPRTLTLYKKNFTEGKVALEIDNLVETNRRPLNDIYMYVVIIDETPN